MTLGNKLVSMTVSRKAGINPLNFILKKKKNNSESKSNEEKNL